jgi:hypothetical protein
MRMWEWVGPQRGIGMESLPIAAEPQEWLSLVLGRVVVCCHTSG